MSSLYAHPKLHNFSQASQRKEDLEAARLSLARAARDFHKARMRRPGGKLGSNYHTEIQKAAAARFVRAARDSRSHAERAFENGSFCMVQGNTVGEVLTVMMINEFPVVYLQLYKMMDDAPEDLPKLQRKIWRALTKQLRLVNVSRYMADPGNGDFFPLSQLTGIAHMVPDLTMPPDKRCFLRVAGEVTGLEGQ